MVIQPYLFFDGRCEEAVNFYRETLGAHVEMMMRYKESPDPAQMPPGAENKIIHASFKIGDSVVMASDGHCTGKPKFDGFSLSITAKDAAEANRVFGALSNGGHVDMPLTKTFFSPSFGMLHDKFGVGWMVIVADHP